MKKMIYSILLFCGMLFSSCNESTEIVVPEKTPTAGDDGSKTEFTEEQLKLPRKKGACFTLRENNRVQNMGRVATLRADWNYSWGPDRIDEQLDYVEFVPMAWGGFDPNVFVPKIQEQINAGHTKRILGFNEPDGVKQANMSVERAIELWPALMSLKIPLGSPAVVDAENGEWIEQFMAEVENKGYRVDYLCVHNYGGGNAEVFKQKMTNIYNKYKRPLLITEFAVADWNAQTPEQNKHSKEKVLNFMKEVLPWLEETEFIYGYAWFSFGPNDAAGCTSALFDENNNLTELGKFYSEFPNNGPVDPEPPVTSDNLLLSPDFEDADAPKNWGNKGPKQNVIFDNKINNPAIAGNIISGNVTLRFAGAKAWADVFQSVKVEKGKTYEFGFTGRILDAAGPEGGASTGKTLSLAIRKDKDNVYETVKVTTGTNTKVSGQITITDDMPETVQVYISKASGIGYVDDVFFREVNK